MTGPEHYREAERLLADQTSPYGEIYVNANEAVLAAAQVHATLALAAATALDPATATQRGHGPMEPNAWREVAATGSGSDAR